MHRRSIGREIHFDTKSQRPAPVLVDRLERSVLRLFCRYPLASSVSYRKHSILPSHPPGTLGAGFRGCKRGFRRLELAAADQEKRRPRLGDSSETSGLPVGGGT